MTNIESSILNNDKISADKYGLAAISHIYKAFGNFVRSKELWPFSEKNGLDWEESNGLENDCETAVKFILRAIEKYKEETEEDDINSSNDFIKKAKIILNLAQFNTDVINETTDAVNNESDNTDNSIHNIISETDE